MILKVAEGLHCLTVSVNSGCNFQTQVIVFFLGTEWKGSHRQCCLKELL